MWVLTALERKFFPMQPTPSRQHSLIPTSGKRRARGSETFRSPFKKLDFMLRKNSCFVSVRHFRGCGKTPVLYPGTTLEAAERLLFCIRAPL
jgi:hypothetical protein